MRGQKAEASLVGIWLLIGSAVWAVTALISIRIGITAGVGVGLGLMAYAWYLGGVAPGAPLGLRNEATLQSTSSWKYVHHLARWLFFLLGGVVVVTSFRSNEWMWVAVVGMGFNVIVLSLVSARLPKHRFTMDR